MNRSDQLISTSSSPVNLDFLARYDLPNTPAERALFISWSQLPEPRPDPRYMA